jgi:hypothetical protein
VLSTVNDWAAHLSKGLGMRAGISPAVWLTKIVLFVLGVALIAAGGLYLAASWMNRTTSATVIGLRRDFSGDVRGGDYQVFYQFLAENRRSAAGSYLLESPTTLGDIPRIGSYLRVRYSALDPAFNRPLTANSEQDFSGAVLAELLCLMGIVLLIAGWKVA